MFQDAQSTIQNANKTSRIIRRVAAAALSWWEVAEFPCCIAAGPDSSERRITTWISEFMCYTHIPNNTACVLRSTVLYNHQGVNNIEGVSLVGLFAPSFLLSLPIARKGKKVISGNEKLFLPTLPLFSVLPPLPSPPPFFPEGLFLETFFAANDRFPSMIRRRWSKNGHVLLLS